MQTAQRRIPIGGDGGKNKTWKEMLVHYENELANFKANLQLLKDRAAGKVTESAAEIKPLSAANVKILNGLAPVKLATGQTCSPMYRARWMHWLPSWKG